MKTIYFIFIAVLLPAISLCQKLTQVNNYEIKLKMSDVKSGAKLYLFYQTEGKKIVDSTVDINGSFHFAGQITNPLPATLVLDVKNEGYKNLLKKSVLYENALQFYMHPGNIVARTDTFLSEAKFITSDINKEFSMFQACFKNIYQQEIILSRKIVTEHDTIKLKQLEMAYDSLKIARMPILKKFIFEHPKSYISLVALWEYYRRLQAIGDYNLTDTHLIECKGAFERLAASVRNSSDGLDFARQFSNAKLLAIGEIAPDFIQPDADGNPVKLSDFKGKFILLDFWASWCGPCRQNNPWLVKLYKEFSGRKFTILGISLDEFDGRTAWLKAIKDDGLLWKQVSDLKHWDNVVAKLYSIGAIPQSILIGPDGRIILKGATQEELRTKLTILLPQK